MIYKLHKNGSYNIHTIKTDRFKSVRMEIVFRNNIDPKTIAMRSCLFEMLLENSQKYKSRRDLALRQEELYNAVTYAVSSKTGATVFTTICLDFLNPKYTDEDYLEDVLSLPFELINNPNVVNNEFDEETLNVIKTRMEADIKSINEDPQKLAINNALKKMDSKSLSGVSLCGTLKDIESITTSNLYEMYNDVLTHDYIDIFIIGDIDMDQAIDIINKKAMFKTIKTHEVKLAISNKVRKKPQIISETSSFTQTQLVMILNTVNLTADERRYAFLVTNMILGGGSLETKLYKNLRDENSLCYTVQSFYQKNDSLVIIHTAIDENNVDKAIKLIKKSINDIQNGDITKQDITRAIDSIKTSINMSLDSPSRIIDQYLFMYIADLEDIETRLKKFKEITVNDVLRTAKKMNINTIYTLKGGEENE